MGGVKAGQVTIKEAKFIKKVVEGNSLADSVEYAYDVGSRENAWSMGKELVRKPRIQQAIQTALHKAGLTPETIAEYLKEGITKGMQSNKATLSDALRGIDLYAKLTGAYHNPTIEQSYKITLQKLPTRKIVAELERRSKTTNQLLSSLDF